MRFMTLEWSVSPFYLKGKLVSGAAAQGFGSGSQDGSEDEDIHDDNRSSRYGRGGSRRYR
ncbi:MAG: hypothetical protein IT566_17220 [Rhodospirillaceae bacterium]|nr:hypothetical protein [Rhodospirillaceae bacterium]